MERRKRGDCTHFCYLLSRSVAAIPKVVLGVLLHPIDLRLQLSFRPGVRSPQLPSDRNRPARCECSAAGYRIRCESSIEREPPWIPAGYFSDYANVWSIPARALATCRRGPSESQSGILRLRRGRKAHAGEASHRLSAERTLLPRNCNQAAFSSLSLLCSASTNGLASGICTTERLLHSTCSSPIGLL